MTGSAALRYIVHTSRKYPINLKVFGHQSLWKQEEAQRINEVSCEKATRVQESDFEEGSALMRNKRS